MNESSTRRSKPRVFLHEELANNSLDGLLDDDLIVFADGGAIFVDTIRRRENFGFDRNAVVIDCERTRRHKDAYDYFSEIISSTAVRVFSIELRACRASTRKRFAWVDAMWHSVSVDVHSSKVLVTFAPPLARFLIDSNSADEIAFVKRQFAEIRELRCQTVRIARLQSKLHSLHFVNNNSNSRTKIHHIY